MVYQMICWIPVQPAIHLLGNTAIPPMKCQHWHQDTEDDGFPQGPVDFMSTWVCHCGTCRQRPQILLDQGARCSSLINNRGRNCTCINQTLGLTKRNRTCFRVFECILYLIAKVFVRDFWLLWAATSFIGFHQVTFLKHTLQIRFLPCKVFDAADSSEDGTATPWQWSREVLQQKPDSNTPGHAHARASISTFRFDLCHWINWGQGNRWSKLKTHFPITFLHFPYLPDSLILKS